MSRCYYALLLINIIAILFSIQGLIESIFIYEADINLIILTFVLAISYIIYFTFTYNTSFSEKNLYIIINTIILLIIFTLIVVLTGGHKSSYKTLFIFCIINVSLKKGTRKGMIISLISSFCILLTDLTFMSTSLIIHHLIGDVILSCVFILIAWIVGYLIDSNEKYINKLKDLANKDKLTQLHNHGYFHMKLLEYFNESSVNSTKLSLIFLDIDNFKRYNHLNGHQQGDYALKYLADILKEIVRSNDIPCRYVGEEFTVILPNTDEKKAFAIAEKIRRVVEKTVFKNQEKQPNGNFTISLGVATLCNKVENELDLIKGADTALYKAKTCKNKVEAYKFN